MGHIRPTPMKYILETKLNPDGTFKKAKARKVLQGIKGKFMLKGIHWRKEMTLPLFQLA